ncbi:hypothetical protein VNPA120661_11270 [Pseudomonas aeruginosa]|nr:hypothetical protein VNPA110516_04290 [Pseudomonas aeruginosa]GLE68145.1 hypothetical protein VNPA110517_19790 [Pseudomonas aeruginosa]GLE74115.1 hypothetical protein VNPA120641_09810 [Pseudomonas aeruginosa]GLE80814.1 hypothetical protein VNPA120661_11270 [Pseudomonas aeruginosa]GLE87049.1 hypothetical protein VNPA120719_04370 [Pseudomonas aeruginosa]
MKRLNTREEKETPWPADSRSKPASIRPAKARSSRALGSVVWASVGKDWIAITAAKDGIDHCASSAADEQSRASKAFA